MSETSPAPTTQTLGGLLRAFVRQLVAAVYSFLAFALVAHIIGEHAWTWLAEPACVLIAAVLTGRIIEGQWWTSSFVGFFVAVVDAMVGVAIVGVPKDTSAWAMLIIMAASTTMVGALGGWIGRRSRRR